MEGHGDEIQDTDEAGPSSATVANSLRTRIPRIIDRWLERLEREPVSRSERLLASYRAFGASLLERIALRLEGRDEDEIAEAELGRAVARAAGETRKSDLATWQAVEDLNSLLPIILTDLASEQDQVGREEIVCDVVGTAAVTLTRVLEATAIRIQRERAETLASMTEVLVHELRNRLGAAETATRMLLNPSTQKDDAWLSRISRLIRDSLHDGLRTVEDVRSLAATRANLEDADLRPMPLRILVREVVREFEPKAAASGVKLGVPEELPRVLVDASRVRLMLTNLVGNAIKYRDPDEGSPDVRINCVQADDGRVHLTVRDNGIGIDEQELDEIFLHRFRGDQVRSIEGTGLGLAIVREAADQLDAEIEVESEVGVGTVFRVILTPLEGPDPEPSA